MPAVARRYLDRRVQRKRIEQFSVGAKHAFKKLGAQSAPHQEHKHQHQRARAKNEFDSRASADRSAMTFGSFIGLGASALTTLLFAGIADAARRSAFAPAAV
jgi:hypothetical protein